MRLFQNSFQKFTPLVLVLLCLFSCSKDSDLLANYVIADNNEFETIALLADDIYFINNTQSSIRLDVLNNDSFSGDSQVSIVGTSEPNSGDVFINEDNTLTYTPHSSTTQEEAQYEDNQRLEEEQSSDEESTPEEDSFDYTTEVTTEDGETLREEATVTITSFEMGELKSFPGAEGFGKFTSGGRGGRVIQVTNLNNGGEGSLRTALESSGPRVIVFKISGYITLESAINITNGDLTIAGQTAPGDGITIRGSASNDMAGLYINASNIIIRGIRVRLGSGKDKGSQGDSLTMTSGTNIIFDHCSFSWATDEIINPWGASRITFQNCIFSEALMYSSHAYSTDPNGDRYYRPHSMGMIVGSNSNQITIYNSIFAHNNQRNPLIGGDTDAGDQFELVNNIYYNWGDFGTTLTAGSGIKANLINNLHIPGPNTNRNRYPIIISDQTTVYSLGNINPFRPSNSDPEWNAIGSGSDGYTKQQNSSNSVKTPFDYPLKNVSTINSVELLDIVTANAGGFARDKVDQRVINDVYNGTGSLIDNPSEVGGYPTLNSGNPYKDSDLDGMDDNWEVLVGLNPSDSFDGVKDRNNDGYTNLEEFLYYLTL